MGQSPFSTCPRQRRQGLAALVSCLLVWTVGCSGDEVDPTQPEPSTALNVTDNAVGRCLRFETDQSSEVFDLPYIACTQPHTHQIFHVFADDRDVYPGFDALESAARVECLDAFDEFVGRSPFDSALFYTWLLPSFDSWNDAERADKEIICLLGRRDGGLLEVSVEGADI